MKNILIIHNFRQSVAPSGEDVVVNEHKKALETGGYSVSTIFTYSDNYSTLLKKVLAVLVSIFNPFTAIQLYRKLKNERPDQVFIHNIFPLISPSIFIVLRLCNVSYSIVMHNYGAYCLNGMLLRQSNKCIKCIDMGSRIWGVKNKCYNQSYVYSLLKYSINLMERALGAYRHATHLIVFTQFQRQQVESFSTPFQSIKVIPHFVDKPTDATVNDEDNSNVIFVGRLSEEKGIEQIVARWTNELPILEIVGSGKLYDQIRQQILDKQKNNIILHGLKDRNWVLDKISNSKLLIFPSVVEETFGLTLIEAMVQSVPVIAYDIGSNLEIITAEAGIVCNNIDSLISQIENIDKINLDRKGALSQERVDRYYSRAYFLKQIGLLFQETDR